MRRRAEAAKRRLLAGRPLTRHDRRQARKAYRDFFKEQTGTEPYWRVFGRQDRAAERDKIYDHNRKVTAEALEFIRG